MYKFRKILIQLIDKITSKYSFRNGIIMKLEQLNNFFEVLFGLNI